MAETLLRLLLMHGSGLSLEQAVLRAKEQGDRHDQRCGAVQALAPLRNLRAGQLQEWTLRFSVGEKIWPIRLCAIRKAHLAAERAKEKARRRAQRQQVQIQPETLEFCEYVLVLTNLDAELWTAAKILELYRCRWQIELAFKRLKSLLKLGHLPKKDPASARAWMQLKLLIALVTEKLCYDARFFSPWGYRL